MSEIAVKDIKKYVTIDELESVLKLCKAEHNRIEGIIQRKNDFNKKIKSKIPDSIPETDKLFLLIDSVSKEMTDKLIEENRDSLDNMNHIIEFFNRFSTYEDRLESIDITTI